MTMNTDSIQDLYDRAAYMAAEFRAEIVYGTAEQWETVILLERAAACLLGAQCQLQQHHEKYDAR